MQIWQWLDMYHSGFLGLHDTLNESLPLSSYLTL